MKTPIYKEDIKEWFQDAITFAVFALFFAFAVVGVVTVLRFFFP